MADLPYPTWIEINLSAIEDNARMIRRWAANTPVMAVVKDNGYGHGAAEVSRAVLRAGWEWLGVVRVHEGVELRAAGIDAPVLVLSGFVPQEVDAALSANLALPVYSMEAAEAISARARALGKTARVHLKIDTGMGRLGVFAEDALEMARQIQGLGGMEIEGLFSHLGTAVEDRDYCAVQVRRFDAALQALRGSGINPRWVHLANSNAALAYPDTHYNLVRVGAALYGQGSDRSVFPSEPRRAFTWKARLLSCKRLPAGSGVGYGLAYTTQSDEWIGVVPVGYGDGYKRVPGTWALVGGEKVPLVSNVCMDLLMLRLPCYYPAGEEVVLIGQQGAETILPDDLQKVWGTTASAVELIHPRVPRIYVHD